MSPLSVNNEGVQEDITVIKGIINDVFNKLKQVQTGYKRVMDARTPEKEIIAYIEENYTRQSKTFSLTGNSICSWLSNADGKKMIDVVFTESTQELFMLEAGSENEIIKKWDRIMYEIAIIEKLLKEWGKDSNKEKRTPTEIIYIKNVLTPAHVRILSSLGIHISMGISKDDEIQLALSLK